mgnify:CR=1 FL=1
MRAPIPTGRIRNRYDPFPQGTYRGRLTEAEVRDPTGEGEWLTIEVTVEDIEPVGETDDPGRSTYSDDLTIQTDGLHVDDVEDFTNDEVPFGLVRTAGLLAGLGEAVGALEIDDGAVENAVDISPILSALNEGEFDGEIVGFEIGHWTNNDDEVNDQFAAFGALE